MTTAQLRTIKSLAKSPTGLSADALIDRGISATTIRALLRAKIIFCGTSALSMTTQWHLTNAGRCEAVLAGFELVDAAGSFKLLLADGSSKSLVEIRP